MGFQTKQTRNYVNVVKGMFAQRVSQDTPGAVSRVLEKGANAGKTVWELQNKEFLGYLLNVAKEPSDFGLQWVFTLKDNESDEIYHLQVPYKDDVAGRILKMLPNIKLDQVVKMTLKKDGDQTAFFLSQQEGNEWVAVKQKFTKDEPNGCPPWEHVEIEGEMKWVRTKELAFLEEVAKDIFNNPSEPTGKLTEGEAMEFDSITEGAVNTATPSTEATADVNPEDIPF